MGLFSRKKSILESGLLKGAVDNHCHILYGLDDGVRTMEESLRILAYLEENGMEEIWFTPHVMEDVPNTTGGLRARLGELEQAYTGGLRFHLAAEYMIDNLFEERLAARDLLTHGDDLVLVETSTWAPPIELWEILGEMMTAGYRPLIAHPERYRYMEMRDYERLRKMGALMQLNLPSIIGAYGDTARLKAEELLSKGMYAMVGSDCHKERILHSWYSAPVLKKDILRRLEPLMKGETSLS